MDTAREKEEAAVCTKHAHAVDVAREEEEAAVCTNHAHAVDAAKEEGETVPEREEQAGQQPMPLEVESDGEEFDKEWTEALWAVLYEAY
jgi:hypothetical protein